MTDLITDKIVIYFIATVAIIGILVGTYFLISLINLQQQHIEIEKTSKHDIEAIDNISKLIVKNQHIILESQEGIINLTGLINNTVQDVIYSPENNKLLKEILNILNSSTKTTQ